MTSRAPLYILDTNVVSELRRPRPNPDVLEWVDRQPSRSLAIAFPILFEIQFGAELARRQSPDKANSLEDWLEGFVLSGRFRILKPCALSVRIRARMHATPSLRGFLESRPGASKPPNGEKLAIASQAIAAGAVVATMNQGDFARIHERFPLPGILNPCSGEWTVAAAPSDRPTPATEGRTGRPDASATPFARRGRPSRWDHGLTTSAPWSALRPPACESANRGP